MSIWCCCAYAHILLKCRIETTKIYKYLPFKAKKKLADVYVPIRRIETHNRCSHIQPTFYVPYGLYGTTVCSHEIYFVFSDPS